MTRRFHQHLPVSDHYSVLFQQLLAWRGPCQAAVPTRARLERSPGRESRVWWDGAGMGGKQRVAQPSAHSQPSQPRRRLCKELFTLGIGAVFHPHSTLQPSHMPKSGGAGAAPWEGVSRCGGTPAWGDLALPPAEPGAGWREWLGALTTDLSSPTIQAKALSPKSALRAMGQAAAGGRGSAPWALPARAGGAALATFPGGVATRSTWGRKLVPCGLFTSRNIRG